MSTGQTPDQLQADIERQREQLAGTIDALSAKLDVKSQARARLDEAKARATTESGRPRPELVLIGATLVMAAVALVWWRRR